MRLAGCLPNPLSPRDQVRVCLSKKSAPPSSTGPAGADFEARVGAAQMLAMLKGAPARGLPEMNIERVELQRAADGFPLDDVILRTLSLSHLYLNSFFQFPIPHPRIYPRFAPAQDNRDRRLLRPLPAAFNLGRNNRKSRYPIRF
jgi:hypothetical protein